MSVKKKCKKETKNITFFNHRNSIDYVSETPNTLIVINILANIRVYYYLKVKSANVDRT